MGTTEMKLFLSLYTFTISKSDSIFTNDKDFDCNVECYKELIKESLKCDLNDDYDENEIEQCHIETLQKWWYSCLGDYCGATLPEGVCAERCIPPLEEGMAKCDDALANGEINQIEHYLCVMGPGGPGPTWELCSAECVCEQPFCNCIPPEEGNSSESGFQPNLRDTVIHCYPDPEE